MTQEFIEEFATQIIVLVVLATGGSVFAYFANLKRCFKKLREESKKEIQEIDARSLRLSRSFLHFVKRNDELHDGARGKTRVKLGQEIEDLLKDPKTGKF